MVCGDSATNTNFFKNSFNHLDLFDFPIATRDSGLIVTYNPLDSLTASGEYNGTGILIIKFNAANKIVWSKKLGTFQNKTLGLLSIAELQNNDILLSGFVLQADQINGKVYNSFLGRLDKNGNLLWLKYYDRFYFDLKNITQAPNGDLMIGALDGSTDLMISRLSGAGNFVWSKIYKKPQPNTFNSLLSNLTLINNQLYAAGFKQCNSSSCNLPASIWSMHFDATNGNVLQIKSYKFPVASSSFGGYKVSFFQNNFVMAGFSQIQNSLTQLFRISLDADFSFINARAYNSSLVIPAAYINPIYISPITGNSTFSIPSQNSGTFYYSIIDSNFNIAYERKLSSFLTGPIPQLSEKNNGRLNFLLTFDNTFNIIDFSPDYLSKAGCTGEDTSIFTAQPLQLTPGDFAWEGVLDNYVASIPAYVRVIDYPIQNQIICKQLSICDSIKIYGADTICNTSQPQIYTVRMRKDCLKKIDWQIDSAAINKLVYVDDTTISLEFKNQWRGNLIASIKSCSITDTFKIYVPEKMPPVDLGPDSMLCKNNSITLYAGKGYKTYLWQNGSTADSLNVSTKGMYSVKASDSCNTISSDTIFVTKPDLTFTINGNQTICMDDSTILSATDGFSNYKWSPATFLNAKSGRTVYAYPSSTTDFYVNADKFPGCNVSDSITIQVNKCPQEIFIPNAFTPNGDGINDVFKPVVTGSLSDYNCRIYNRLGQLIFQTHNPVEGWNGRLNGALQNIGVYVWICEYTFRRLPKKSSSGKLILLL